MTFKRCFITVSVIAATFALTGTARAEIVFLSSGRTLSVQAHRVEGDTIVLTLRNGGEVTCDKSLNRGWWPWMLGQLRPTHLYSVVLSDLR